MSNYNKGKNDVISFFVGLAMICVGGYLFMENVTVISTDVFTINLFGRSMNGVIFIPFIASIIFLFYKYCLVSKLCCIFSLLLIATNVIMHLKLIWNAATLFQTIVIFVLLFGGLGLVMKVVFANPDGNHGKNYKE